MKVEVDRLALERKYGQVQKVVVDGDLPLPFYSYGDGVGENYFEVPVSVVLRAAMGSSGKTTAFVTKVVLELDLLHAAECEFFSICVVKSAGFPSVSVDVTNGHFQMGVGGEDPDQKRVMMRIHHERVATLAAGVLLAPARDGSLFGAVLSNHGSPYVKRCEGRINGGKARMHQGRAAYGLQRKAGNASVSDTRVKDTVRLCWTMEKQVMVGPVGNYGLAESIEDECVLFCGVRPVVEMAGNMGSGKPQDTFGIVQNVRLSLHGRF
ncbi:Uu.00g010910.m01.CDS01 [Anthostomella pinea]|uniref:Uu.00g010910.m01.CDS01 n=1 Tax=Anthostomella pinea TaxID=933095 RepID=A0AAI8VXP4_9PEZI|nr:Uu.00g010910.m01.CDS01 [Anthostomella pinea]